MIAVSDFAIAVGAAPINKHPGCWEHKVDERWWLSANGHRVPVTNSRGVKVQPFHVYVEFNGWPAGVFSPYGGEFAAGSTANEATFIAALGQR